jgi:hypothetical protein
LVEIAATITIVFVEIPVPVKPAIPVVATAEAVIEARRKSEVRAVYRRVPISRDPNLLTVIL